MAYTVPTFNLTCNVYTGPWLTRVLRTAGLVCNLAIGRRVQQQYQVETGTVAGPASPLLLVPAGSDVRDDGNATGADLIECPAGSGRWYGVLIVDDMAKGFSNEYRLVGMTKACQANDAVAWAGLFWPTPIP